MILSAVLTPWAGNGSESNPYHPQLLDDHPIQSFVDATHQPAANLTPDPNLFVIQVICTEQQLTAIEADSNYYVLWSENA
jgi:hypothetical protein